jgi:hypothetical protein
MTFRGRIIAAIVGGIALVVLISAAIYFFGKNKPQATNTQTTQNNTPSNVIESNNFDQNNGLINVPANLITQPRVAASPLEIEQNSVRQLAKIFTERFNTYSTDSGSQNIKEVQNLVSASMWKRITGKGDTSGGTFMGVTTEALTTSLDSWKPPSATVSLQTRRTIEQNGLTSQKNQTITVTLTKASGSWLVDSYAWQQ